MNSDYQRVVEYLRDLRQGPLQAVTDEIAQAAADYASLCVQANERLRNCSTFLQQGLRGEAIHLAEESPNLLDLVAALDLPDPNTWSEFCQNNGLPVPPPLQMDRASQLNDAYALDQPLEHLLSRHRLLALSRAPVRQRLEVLRQIAQIDAGGGAGGSWEKDIRIFEHARLRELPTAFYNAVKNRDEHVIASLMTELNETTWFEPPPADLTTAVADAFRRMQRAGCEADLRKLLERLRDAFAARSLKECQALVNRWRKIMTAANVTRVSRDLEDEIKPVVAWVSEEEKREELLKRFRESCKAFAALLDRDVPDAQLEAGYAKLVEFKEPIPEELTERYTQKTQARQRATDRRHRVRLVTIGASVAAVVGLILITAWVFMRANTAHSWAKKINDAADARDLSTARAYVTQLQKEQPGLLTNPEVGQAIARTVRLMAHHDNARAQLYDLLRQADDADKAASPVAAAADASIDQLLAGAASVQQVLDQAQKDGDLTWVDTDNSLSRSLIHLNGLSTDLRSKASAAIRAQVDKDSAAVDALQISPGTSARAFAQLQQMADRVATLKSAAGLDDDTRAALTSLATKIDQRKSSLDTTQAVAAALENIRQQALSADELKKALTVFTEHFPTDPRTPEFAQAIRTLPWASALESWHKVVNAWGGAGGKFAPVSEDGARKRIDSVAAYLTDNPDSPMAPAALTYQDYLRRAADALAEKGTWQTEFNALLTHPLMSELAYMETSDHHRFYVLGDLNRKTRSINNQVSVTFDALDPADPTYTKRLQVSVDAPTTVSEDPIPLPHTKLIAQLADSIKRIDETNWDTWGIDLIERLRTDDQIDLVVRATIIHQALKTQQNVAGWALGDTYAKALAELARQKPEQLSIINPASVTEGTRAALKDIIAALPPGAAVKQKLADVKSTLFRTLAFEVAATGVALKNDAGGGGSWTVFAHNAMPDGYRLYTVTAGVPAAAPVPAPAAPAPAAPAAAASAPASDTPAAAAAAAAPAPAPAPPVAANPGALLQIGIVGKAQYTLNDDALRNIPQGSIVYVVKP